MENAVTKIYRFTTVFCKNCNETKTAKTFDSALFAQGHEPVKDAGGEDSAAAKHCHQPNTERERYNGHAAKKAHKIHILNTVHVVAKM